MLFQFGEIDMWTNRVSLIMFLAAAPAISMDKPREFPHAGITLAVPKGFEDQRLVEPSDVMRAVLLEADQPVRAVTLTAAAIAADHTADAFAEAQLAELKQNLAIRKLKVLSKTQLSVCGVTGTAWLMSYSFRGIDTIAARAYFIRDWPREKLRICYMLTVEAPAEKQTFVLPTLGEVIKTVAFSAPLHPYEVKLTFTANVMKDHGRGCSIRVPAGWFANLSDTGMLLGQMDYLLGGEPNPLVTVLIGEVPAGSTGQSCAEKVLQAARDAYARQNIEMKLLRQGPAKLASMAAYQFTIQQTTRPPAADTQPTQPAGDDKKNNVITVVHRTACCDAAKCQQARSFSIIVACSGAAPPAAEAIMDKLADGFELLEATTQPATAAAPAEKK